jgi:hypothetical protein
MAAAGRACHLGASHQQLAIRVQLDAFPRYRVSEARPARPRVKLRLRGEQRRPARRAAIHPVGLGMHVAAGERQLGSLAAQHPELGRRHSARHSSSVLSIRIVIAHHHARRRFQTNNEQHADPSNPGQPRPPGAGRRIEDEHDYPGPAARSRSDWSSSVWVTTQAAPLAPFPPCARNEPAADHAAPGFPVHTIRQHGRPEPDVGSPVETAG